MAIESSKWENKRQGDVEGMEESSLLPIEAMARICDVAFFPDYKIVTGFECIVRTAVPQDVEVGAGFAFPGLDPNIPIDLEAAEYAHILAGTDGVDGFGNGSAAHGTLPRFDLIVMTRQALPTTSVQKYFIDDTTDPPTYPQAYTNTRYNQGDFVGGVVHGTPTAGAVAAVWAARGAIPTNYVAIAVVYIPAGVTSLSDPGVVITDPNDPWIYAFDPPWPTDVLANPLSARVSSLTATAPLAVDVATGPVTISLAYGDGLEVAASTLKAKLGNGLTVAAGAIAALLGDGLEFATGAIRALVGYGLKRYVDGKVGVYAGTAISIGVDDTLNVDLGTLSTQAAAGNHTHAGLGGSGFVLLAATVEPPASVADVAVTVTPGDTASLVLYKGYYFDAPLSYALTPGGAASEVALNAATTPATDYRQALIPCVAANTIRIASTASPAAQLTQIGYFKA